VVSSLEEGGEVVFFSNRIQEKWENPSTHLKGDGLKPLGEWPDIFEAKVSTLSMEK